MYDGTHDQTGSDTQMSRDDVARMGMTRKAYEAKNAVRDLEALTGLGRELTPAQEKALRETAKSIDRLLARDLGAAA